MLNSGTRLGPYQVLAKLGEGGMGEVYRARDTKLDRDVALKILPEAVAADPDRLMRFEREAKTLATLNHPNIAHIHGIEESGGTRALVMELVEGEDLSQRIERGAIPLDEAVPIARQIAEALEAAHEAGIIHRDLKPANVKVRPDGLVKVLDFGLAKALDPLAAGAGSSPPGSGPAEAGPSSGSALPTMTSPALTAMGMILGTAAYMSPEQAKGRPVDRRADIWAFGVVLYEMLTGRQMFHAETVGESIAAVLRADIDLDALPASTPASIRRLLVRCLDRDPKTRLQHIGEARVTLAQSPGAEEEVRPAPPSSPRSVWPWVASTAVVAGTLAFVAAWSLRPEPAAPKPVTFALDAEGAGWALVSPDGLRVAYRTPADGQLWVRDLDQLEPRPLVRVDGLAAIGGPGLFWSPDGNELGYASADALWRISAEGGAPIEICRLENGSITGAAWRDDGRIIFGSWRGGLYEVAASGATKPVLVRDVPEGVVDFHGPKLLPNGALAYTLHFNETNEHPVEIVDAGRTVTLPDSAGSWYSAGYLLSTRESGSGLWATPFDLETLTVTGDPFLVVPDATSFSASFDGTLVYSTGGESGPELSKLTWAALDGTREALPGDAREYEEFTLSPDGARVAAVVNERGESGIQLIDVTRGAAVPLAALSGTDKFAPRWSPDGRYVLYVEERGFVNTIRAAPADGSRQPFDIIEGIRFDLAPDGRMLVFERDDRGRRSLWKVDLDDYRPAGEPMVLREGLQGVSVRYPAVSPDGSLVAYVQSSQFSDVEVFLSRLPDGSGQWAVSTGGGTRPGWDSTTGDLLFRAAGGLVEVPVTPGEQPRIGEPRTRLGSGPSTTDVFFGGRPMVGRDGRVLVAAPIASAADAAPVRIIVLQNWPTTVGERAR